MPERVRYAMMRQAINHRSAEFGAVYADCVRVLKTAFGTTNDLFIISGSGTAGMESAVAGVGRDKEIACLVNGKFGERLFKISQRYGKAHEIATEWGTPLDLAALEAKLEQGVGIVTLVHNETSAGIKNPAQEVGKMARKHDALLIMDGITSIGGDLVEADKWGVDIAITGSQKCLAAPAGLAAVSVSGRAWERMTKNPPYYLDLAAYRKSASGKPMETPYTPAVPLFLALREACLIIEEEGMQARIARHRKLAGAVRAAAAAWGLEFYPRCDKLHSPSETVTAIKYPDGLNDGVKDIVKKMGIIVAGGQDHLKGKIFRIGSMGAVGAPELIATLGAVQFSLKKNGYNLKGDGVESACEVLG
jgi:aspartate aminotransferase-like enzyme